MVHFQKLLNNDLLLNRLLVKRLKNWKMNWGLLLFAVAIKVLVLHRKGKLCLLKRKRL